MTETEGTQAEIEALAAAWPRPLIALELAEPLARWWWASRAAAIGVGEAAFPRHKASSDLSGVLFEARRARRVVRGLEESAKALDTQQRGLAQSPATQLKAGQRRISRLLVLSSDGSARFYRDVEKTCRRYSARVEAIVLEQDETMLGETVFGPGRVARAVLLNHKDAVIDFLGTLEAEIGGSD